jgi:proline iminopeptidase
MRASTGFIDVGQGHKLYYETLGHPSGIPFIFIHGGPGYGFFELDKRFFDPEHHFVILYDQRGAGKSQPYACIDNNTTFDQVEDILTILQYFHINKVNIFGGSWGSMLALLFAMKHPGYVGHMVLRGVFTAANDSIDLFASVEGYPHLEKARDRVLSFVPGKDSKIAGSYFLDKMKSGSEEEKKKYAYELELYGSILNLPDKPVSYLEKELTKRPFFAHAIIVAHYMVNKFFIEDNYIWSNIIKLRHFPMSIVHGAHDAICPISNATRLHEAVPASKLYIEEGGHSSLDPAIDARLKKIMKTFK